MEDELNKVTRSIRDQKEQIEIIQMDILKNDNRLKEIKERENFIRYELDKF